MSANCYIAGCPKTRKAAVIDPGGDASRIKRLLEKELIDIEEEKVLLSMPELKSHSPAAGAAATNT
jgi:hypothetical protein